MTSTLKDVLSSHIKTSAAGYEAFMNAAELKYTPKNKIISCPGKIQENIFFIEKGLLRAYRIVNGQEYTHFFYLEHWFATDFQSFLKAQASSLYIESLTDVTYYEFSKKNWLNCYLLDPQFEKLGRIIAEKAYLIMAERLVDFQTMNLKERYHKLIRKNPQLFQKVPQKYIASYLGVAEQSLSRIKSDRTLIS